MHSDRSDLKAAAAYFLPSFRYTVARLMPSIRAVLDALRPLGVRDLEMPATSHRVWEAMRKGSVSAEQQPQKPATTAATQGRPAA
jgi:hypothetical protein